MTHRERENQRSLILNEGVCLLVVAETSQNSFIMKGDLDMHVWINSLHKATTGEEAGRERDPATGTEFAGRAHLELAIGVGCVGENIA